MAGPKVLLSFGTGLAAGAGLCYLVHCLKRSKEAPAATKADTQHAMPSTAQCTSSVRGFQVWTLW